MDPISQGTIGAGFAQSLSRSPETIGSYALFGCLAGLAPDLDIFIQSSTDPLLFLEYHRQFTHSLFFIPIGALVVAGVLFKAFKHPLTWREAYLASLVGYATHGLLDACTSYGTQLFWPLTDYRVAWNNVSVVDPIFTIPMLFFVIVARWRRKRSYTFVALGWALGYLLLGVVQHERAWAAAENIAASRGHEPNRLTLKPGFANIVLWKLVYEHDGYYYVDALRVLDDVGWCPGERAVKLDMTKHLPDLDPTSQQATDIERFRWFSQDYIAFRESDQLVVDMRYSTVPNEAQPMWGVQVDPGAPNGQHITWWTERGADSRQRAKIGELLNGTACRPLP